MAIEKILAALDGQADAEIADIYAVAQEEANRVLAQAQQKADNEKVRYVNETRIAKQTVAERELNSANTVMHRALADVKREVFDEVFVEARKQLDTLRGTEQYSVILKYLIQEASNGMGDIFVVHIDPRDENLVHTLFPGEDAPAQIVLDISTIGGAVVTSADGRVQRSNTFEDRLARVQDSCVQEISEVLSQ